MVGAISFYFKFILVKVLVQGEPIYFPGVELIHYLIHFNDHKIRFKKKIIYINLF